MFYLLTIWFHLYVFINNELFLIVQRFCKVTISCTNWIIFVSQIPSYVSLPA